MANQSFTNTRVRIGSCSGISQLIMAVGAAHEMALRTAAHPADVLNGLGWHGGLPINSVVS